MRSLLIALAAAAVGSPAFAQPDVRQWNLFIDDEVAQLSWAIPESDDGGPMFACAPGDGMVKITQLVEHRLATEAPTTDGAWVDAAGRPAPWAGEMTITSGKLSETYAAVVTPEEMYGGSIVEAEAAPESPVMASFGRTGVIVLSSFGERERPAPAPTAKVGALLKACLPGS